MTDLDIIRKIVTDQRTTGNDLLNTNCQNELAVRFMAHFNPLFRDFLYDLKLDFNAYVKIETITRTAGEIEKDMRTTTSLDLMRSFSTPVHKLVYQALKDMGGLLNMPDIYADNTVLCFQVWRQQSVMLDSWLKDHPVALKTMRAFKLISITRQARMLIEQGFGQRPKVKA